MKALGVFFQLVCGANLGVLIIALAKWALALGIAVSVFRLVAFPVRLALGWVKKRLALS